MGVDKKIGNDICLNSNLNNHRPFRASIKVVTTKNPLIKEEFKKANETIVYKVCSTYPSSGSKDPYKCYKIEGKQGDFIGINCGWNFLRMFHYYGVHPFLCLFSLVGIVWMIKDKSYWILSGITVRKNKSKHSLINSFINNLVYIFSNYWIWITNLDICC